MQILLYPFIALAGIGLVLSLIIHVLVHFRYDLLGDITFFAMHAGVFVVGLPAVLALMRGGTFRVQMSVSPRAGWQAFQQMTRGSPKWMQRMTAGFFIYVFANFVLSAAVENALKWNQLPKSPAMAWVFSSFWMAFYSAALTILYSTLRTRNAPLKCPAGHVVSPIDQFCPECGAALSGAVQRAGA
jgi:hypothetical protein